MMFPFESAHLEEKKQIFTSLLQKNSTLYSVDATQALLQQSQTPTQEHPSSETAEGEKGRVK